MQYLNSEYRIGNLMVKNRIVMPPMETGKSDGDRINQRVIDWYLSRAEAGTGLIILEHAYVDPVGKAARQNDKEAVNVSASAVKRPGRSNEAIPHALTVSEIREIQQKFADAAVRVKKSGFDGVEIHCAHAYLLNQFLSPVLNHREDAYGGSLENRLRMTTETLQAVRAAVGNDFPISVRLGGVDYGFEGGNTIADAVEAARILEENGADLISVSGGVSSYYRLDNKNPGWFSDMSSAIKEAVKLPVLLTGGIKTGKDGEALLEAGVCDFVGVGRSMLQNAEWSRKALGLKRRRYDDRTAER